MGRAQIFTSVKVRRPNMNNFDMSMDHKFTGRIGWLMPTFFQDCVPSDSFQISCDMLCRFNPLLAPAMQEITCSTMYYFVPYRVLWPEWEDFMQDDPAAIMPFITVDAGTGQAANRFMEFFGIPNFGDMPTAVAKEINALPFAAYQMIYNEWFRDQNRIPEVDFELVSGDNSGNSDLLVQRLVSHEHDYFTAALNSPQAGAAVDIPIGDVRLKSGWDTLAGSPHFEGVASTPIGSVDQNASGEIQVGATTPTAYDPEGSLESGPTTLNDLRTATRMQELLELMGRVGKRLTELIRGFFGVDAGDGRLQRPEYITGVKAPVMISEVLQNSETNVTPQGTMAGRAVALANGYGGKYFVREHGCIIGVTFVRPRVNYFQGLPRFFLQRDKYDFYWPQLANIGEQEIFNDEVFAYQATGTQTWGYIPRYSHMKYNPNRTSGDFAPYPSGTPRPFEFWSLTRAFATLPTLSDAFLEVDPDDNDRIFAVQSSDEELLFDVFHKVKARRPMPVYGTPYL